MLFVEAVSYKNVFTQFYGFVECSHLRKGNKILVGAFVFLAHERGKRCQVSMPVNWLEPSQLMIVF